MNDAGDPTEEEVRSYFERLSNWGRWGGADARGALNYITPEKKKLAASLVSDGTSLSLSLPLPTKPGINNPSPALHLMIRTGHEPESRAMPSSSDFFAFAPHGLAMTHVDAFCHVFYRGKMYNGHDATEVTTTGAKRGSVDAFKDGIVARGVLVDSPRLRGKKWLEPGEALHPRDLIAAEDVCRFKIESGDVLFVRTGRHARTKDSGEIDELKQGMAGLHAACLPWLHDRQVAMLAGDGVQDVMPSGYRIALPIHAVGLVAMGLPLIDNCDLDPLAEACASRGRWTFMVVIAPLFIEGATGSPVNPIAVF